MYPVPEKGWMDAGGKAEKWTNLVLPHTHLPLPRGDCQKTILMLKLWEHGWVCIGVGRTSPGLCIRSRRFYLRKASPHK